jgi:hypothetical protein
MIAETELPDVSVTQNGSNVTFQPAGPDALKPTVPLNPPRDATVAVRLTVDPLFTLTVEVEVEIEKSSF